MGLFRRGGPHPLLVLIGILIGAVLGSLVGDMLRDVLPIMAVSRSAGFSLDNLDLAGVLSLHLGLTLQVNLATILGIVLGVFLVRRL